MIRAPEDIRRPYPHRLRLELTACMKYPLYPALVGAVLAALLSAGGPLRAEDIRNIAVSTPSDTYWWAGIIDHGFQMPLTNGYKADLDGDTYGNQSQPLLLSSQGDVIWSEDALTFRLSQSDLVVESHGQPVRRFKSGHSLRNAFLFASRNYFPPSGKIPSELLFLAPQYNTWIELMYNQNQQDI